MTQKRKRPHIRFVRGWMGRPIGHIDRGLLDPGVAMTLVQRGMAVLVEDDNDDADELPIRKRGRPRKLTANEISDE